MLLLLAETSTVALEAHQGKWEILRALKAPSPSASLGLGCCPLVMMKYEVGCLSYSGWIWLMLVMFREDGE